MVDESFKFVDESCLFEVKKRAEDIGFSLEEIIVELSFINEDALLMDAAPDDLLMKVTTKCKQELKNTYLKVRPKIYPIMEAWSACYLRQKERKALWRNGFVGQMIKENDLVKRLSMRIFFHMYNYFYSMEYALKTDEPNYFLAATKEIRSILKAFHSASSLHLAKINLQVKSLRKQRGKENMSEVSASKSERNKRIKAANAEFVINGRKREAAGILASRFNLTPAQIRAIVK